MIKLILNVWSLLYRFPEVVFVVINIIYCRRYVVKGSFDETKFENELKQMKLFKVVVFPAILVNKYIIAKKNGKVVTQKNGNTKQETTI